MGNVSSGEEEETNTVDALGLPESLKTNSNQINFHDACLANNISFKFFKEIVCELYTDDAKFLLSQQDAHQALPFHHAIVSGDFEIVSFLLKKSVDLKLYESAKELINKPIINNVTSTHIAITSSSLEILQLFIENGADLNVQTSMGATPLHVASVCGSDKAEAGSLEMVKLVLTNENINLRTTSNETALFLALNHYSTEAASLKISEEIINYLMDQEGIDISTHMDCPQSMLSLASQKGYLKIFKALLADQKDKDNIDFEAPGGYHCLHLAAKCGAEEIVSIILSHGVNVDVLSKKKETALLLAVANNHLNMVKLLVSKGANVNYTGFGSPILSYACGQGKTEIASFLLDSGANPANKDKHSNTALHLAACEGNFSEIIELLLSKLNNVNEKNGKGRTPLYLACDRTSNDKTVEILLKYGAEVNDTSPKGATALHVAAHRGSAGICRLLLNHGADAGLYTNDGKLPIHFSVEGGYKECVSVLLEKTKPSDIEYLRNLVIINQKRKSPSAQITQLLLKRIEDLLLNK